MIYNQNGITIHVFHWVKEVKVVFNVSQKLPQNQN